MTGKIIQTDTLTPIEEKQLFEWGDDIFGGDELGLSWRPMELRFIQKIDGESVGHLGLIKDQIEVDGKLFNIAGVGDIVTIPEIRGKGVAKKLLNHSMDFFINEWKVDAGVLFCFDSLVPFYQACGWQIANNKVFVMQPSGQIQFPNQLMVYPAEGIIWPEGTIYLNCLPW
jgi:GNAT superfamily N-acetyltransferase